MKYTVTIPAIYFSEEPNNKNEEHELPTEIASMIVGKKQTGIDYRLSPNNKRTMFRLLENKIKQEQAEIMTELIEEIGKPDKTLKPPISLTITFYSKNKRKIDLDGLLGSQKGYIDATTGVIVEDDSANIITCIKLYYKSNVDEPKVVFEFEEQSPT